MNGENGQRNGEGHDRRSTDQWHLAKDIPLALLVGIVLQTGGVVWWLSSLNSAVASNVSALSKIEARVGSVEAQITSFASNIAAPSAVNGQRIGVMESDLRDLRRQTDSMQIEMTRRGPIIERLNAISQSRR